MHELPELPDGYSWQLCQGEWDRTGHIDLADADAVRLWCESGDLAIALTRVGTGWEVAEGYHCGRVVHTLDEAVTLAGVA